MNRRSHAEESIYERAAFDSISNQKNRSNIKQQAIIDTWQQPILPKLSKILFISMLALSLATTLVEVKHAMMSISHPIHQLGANLSVTLLYLWSIYSVLLISCSLLGSFANFHSYKKRKAESGIQDISDEDRLRSKRAIIRMNAAYLFYIKVCVIGLIAITVLYCLTHP